MNKKNCTLFLLKTFNDIDYIAPVIWKVVSMGDKASIIFVENINYSNDYRIAFLRKMYQVPIINFPLYHYFYNILQNSNSYIIKLAGRIVNRIYREIVLRLFLKNKQITTCIYEMGDAPGGGL